ncbi:uridine kinase [Actinosynnema sp. NPDC047251]|uniref:Phosphoribulokinase / uridine kinase family n=1 Tax=Saccharothrix espanaensis (strain ATCC 51144 / DSM 44229 / JCM 9112 / NBRC 15066 / NRRL 15764) TaxID=1179773 RepID=K0JR64_SACES|nr:phosphoribulokinase [Saccharothrix espanaensis]CCH27772.1 Phosphoribulokinase / uridine kinase family [Saccharothrix espanaensis DSM 44229]
MVTSTPRRTAVLAEIAASVAALHPDRVVRVGVDGVDGAGKTTFADELADALAPSGRPTIRAGVDGFHHPRSVRHRRGRDSPEGFFHDSYDYGQLRTSLLDPLGPAGHRRYRTRAFDHETDRPVEPTWALAPRDAILVVDGIFLHRPELRPCWDYSVFLHVDFTVSLGRAAARGDLDPDPAAPANRRYVQGQLLYLDQCRPHDLASVVVDNNSLGTPRITRPTT